MGKEIWFLKFEEGHLYCFFCICQKYFPRIWNLNLFKALNLNVDPLSSIKQAQQLPVYIFKALSSVGP